MNDDRTPARAMGFGLAALGALLMGVGSLTTWVRSGLPGVDDAVTPAYRGVDLPEGLVCLAATVVVLLALAATRVAASDRVRRTAAALVAGASCVAIVAAIVAIVTVAGRVESSAVRDIVGAVAPSQEVTDEQRARIEELVETRLAPGPFAALGGGLLGAAGGFLLWRGGGRGQAPSPPPRAS